MEDQEEIRVFVSGGCGPCEEVRRLIKDGRFDQPKVNMLDLSTDEGRPYLKQFDMKKVPIAFRGAKECALSIDDEDHVLRIDCGDDDEEPTSMEPET